MGRRAVGTSSSIRGVNLGNWLVLERWMDPETSGPFAGAKADDERTLRKELDEAELQARLKQHRDSYVTRDTFLWLTDHGCNLVRLPLPYHLYGDSSHESCIDYVENAMDWAAECNMPMLLDLHTVPGGQNGFDNSGQSGLCTWHLESRQVAQTLAVLERVSRQYADHPTLFGVEAMNEPASKHIFKGSMKRYGVEHPERVERSAPIPHQVLAQFYKLVYERLRPILGPRVALVFHDQFRLYSWDRFMPKDRYPNVWIDTHQYIASYMRNTHMTTFHAHLLFTRALGARIAYAQRFHPVLVGEWSLSNNVKSLSKLSKDRRTAMMRRYSAAQLAAFERGAGGCFWSIENGRFATWSFRKSVDKGWIDYRM